MNTANIIELLNSEFKTVPVTSTGTELSPQWELLSTATLAHLVWHGLKQKLNDPNGAKTLSDIEKDANSRKVLDSIEANEVRMVSGRIADPVEAELMKQARNIVANKLIAKGHKLKDYKLADLTKLAEAMLENYPAVEQTLRANAEATVAAAVDAKSKFADIEI